MDCFDNCVSLRQIQFYDKVSMKKSLFVLNFLLLSFVCSGADYKVLYERIDSLYEKKNYKLAEELLLDAIKKDSLNVNLYENLAITQWLNKKLRDALKSLNKAHEIIPGSTRILLSRAKLKEELNDSLGALEDLDYAIYRHSYNVRSLYQRALYHKFHKNFDKALIDLERIVLINDSHFNARLQIPLIKKRQGKLYESLAGYSKLCIDFPGKSVAWNNLADTEMLLNDFKCAIEHVEKSISLDPKYSTAFLTRGEIRLKMKDSIKACKDFQKAFELCDEDMKEKIGKFLLNCK